MGFEPTTLCTCTCIDSSVPTCTCIDSSVPTCTCIDSSVPTGTCIDSSVPTCTCIDSSVPTCTFALYVHVFVFLETCTAYTVLSTVISQIESSSTQTKDSDGKLNVCIFYSLS